MSGSCCAAHRDDAGGIERLARQNSKDRAAGTRSAYIGAVIVWRSSDSPGSPRLAQPYAVPGRGRHRNQTLWLRRRAAESAAKRSRAGRATALRRPSVRSKGSGLRRLPGREQPSGGNPIGDRSGDRARDQEAKRSPQIVAMPPARRELNTLARKRRRHPEDLALVSGTRAQGRKPGYGRQLGGARETQILLPGAMPGFGPDHHGLVFEPVDARFKPMKIVVAGLGWAKSDGYNPEPAIGRPGHSRMIGAGIREIWIRENRRISQWGNHARMLPVAPDRLPP
jgi:hypothetical protein